ncbi:uncharacterized protein [Miscanthus floridulus]|uniref:uncharacterized protein n=1 Tax=Miscanthus floridulus TaxID=154761 RepID=UPI003459F08D
MASVEDIVNVADRLINFLVGVAGIGLLGWSVPGSSLALLIFGSLLARVDEVGCIGSISFFLTTSLVVGVSSFTSPTLGARSVATGDLNFTSTEHLQPAPLVPIAAPAAPAALAAPAAPVAPVAVPDSTSPGATFDGLDVSSARNEAQSAPSNQDSVQGTSGGRKRKQSHIGAAIDGFVQFKKMQTSKTMEALNEKKKQDEAFSVDKCLDEVDAMELTDVEKAYAMNIFKSEIDREVFMKMKNKNVRLIWLKQQISAICRGNVGGGNV